MQPILSVLIPTYNRVDCLVECLESLVHENVFLQDSKVEILVSDNCSTDGTREIGEEYAHKHPDKIKYFRQLQNFGPSENFTFLIRHGCGKFLKFVNDRIALDSGALSRIVATVEKHETEHPVLYFGNEEAMHISAGTYQMRSFDDLADILSYWTTSIGGYGFWRDETDFVVPIQDKYAASLLQQTAVIWKLFEKNRVGYFYNYKIYHHCKGPAPSCRYNVAEVFSKNYLAIISEFLRPGQLSRIAYNRELKRVYFGHIFGMYFDFEKCLNYQKTGFLRYTREYWGKWYYWISLMLVPFFYFVGSMSPELRMRFWDALRRMRKVICSHDA